MCKGAASVLLSVVALTGCHRQPQRVLSLPPQAPAVRTAPPADLPVPPQVEAPAPTTELPPSTAANPPAPPATQAASPKVNRRARVKKEQPTPAAVEPSEAPSAPVAASGLPQLGEILSPRDRNRLNADLDRALRNARNSLRSVTGKALNPQQQTAVAQAESFLRQAAETRLQDLASARSLAQRAEVIARDLARTVR